MSFTYEQEPYAQFADAGQPLYFRRRYGGNPMEPFERDGIVYVSMAPAKALWIYGYSVSSHDPHDKFQERYAWNERRSFVAWCYSTMEPRGEPGFVPMDDVEPITREQFEQAAANRWQEVTDG